MSLNLERPLTYLITKGETTDSNFAEKAGEITGIARIAVANGISLMQIREKSVSTRNLFELTTQVASITYGTPTRLLVNDRADVALAAGADGVHLSSISLPANVIRKNFPSTFLIGVSVHTFEETEKAAYLGADFAVYGPVFKTPGKDAVTGTVGLADICSRLPNFPVLGLGGVNGKNCSSVLETGAAGFAAIRWLNDPENLMSFHKPTH